MGIENPSDGSFQGKADPGQISGDPKTVDPGQVQTGKQTEGDQQQTFVTADQLNKRFEDLDKNIQRQLQSYGDKTENRLATQVQEANALLEARFVDLESRGIKIPEKFKDDERTRVLQEGLAASEPPSLIDVAGLQVDERYINDVNYVNYTAYQMANKAGFIVGKDDPEFASLAKKGTGQQYLESYQKALNDKAARTGVTLPNVQLSGTETQPKVVVPGSTIPAGGGEVPPNWADETDPSKLIAMGLANMD